MSLNPSCYFFNHVAFQTVKSMIGESLAGVAAIIAAMHGDQLFLVPGRQFVHEARNIGISAKLAAIQLMVHNQNRYRKFL